jgi:methyl-accepting chemotaxis protein
MTEMDKVTQGNATSAEESASAAEELRAQALSMQGTVDLLRRLVGRQPAATGKATGGRRASPTAIGTRPPPALPRRAPANGMRSRDRIPMPKDAAPATAAVDHEDKHFTNF